MSIDTLIDRARLSAWLDTHLPELGDGALQARLISGGTSNAIVALHRGKNGVVLRRPSLNPPPASVRAMKREAQMLRALAGTAVPHPRFHALCEDASIIGAPFYIMEQVQGWSARVGFDDFSYPAPFDRGVHRHQVGFALVDALAALAATDYRALGLETFGKPDGFLQRQVDRWLSQLHSYPAKYPGYVLRDIPGLDYVSHWLRERCPVDGHMGIIHGDYGSANVIFGHDTPARVVAILDWELSTVGDPLLDLAWLLFNYCDRAAPDQRPVAAHFDPRGFPTRQDLAERYAEQTGIDISNLDYYLVLAQFKLACIVEYKVAEVAAGFRTLQDVGYRVDDMVLRLIASARDIAHQTR